MKTTLSPAEQMLIQAISAAVRGGSADLTGPLSEQSWAEFFSAAAVQKLLPLAYQAVYRSPAAEGSAVVRQFKSAAVQQVALQVMKNETFYGLYTGLQQADLHPLVVKGIVCRDVYPAGDYRPSTDEDILIPDSEWAAACRVLTELGCTFFDEADAQPEKQAAAFEIGFQKDGLLIELHRSLFSPDSEAFGGYNGYFTDAHEKSAEYALKDGKKVRSLNPESHLLYMMLHACKHFAYSGFGLRQVCDMGLWAEKYENEIDFNRLADALADAGALTFADAILRIARDTFGIRCRTLCEGQSLREGAVEGCGSGANKNSKSGRAGALPDTRPLLMDMISGGLYGSSDLSRLHSASLTLENVEKGKNTGLAAALKAAFPAREKLLRQYPELEKHPARLPLVWMRRILRYLRETKSTDNNAASESLRIARERTELLKMYKVI